MTTPCEDENDGDRRLLAAMAYRPRDQRRMTPIVEAACDLRGALVGALGPPPPGRPGDPARPLPKWRASVNYGTGDIEIYLTAEAARALLARLAPPSPPPARRRRRA